MSIKELPLQPSFVIAPDAPTAQALQYMLQHKVNHVAVCEGRQVVGLVGIDDVLRQLIPASVRQPGRMMDLTFAGDVERLLGANLKKLEQLPVCEILQPVPPLPESCPLLEAALLLYQSAGPLAVVDADGNFKGMLSRRIFVEYLARAAEA